MNIYYEKQEPFSPKIEEYNRLISRVLNPRIEDADIIVVAGGDGSLLEAISKYKNHKAYLWGYNLGTVGFLMNDRMPYLEDDPNDFDYLEFPMLHAKVIDRDGVVHETDSFNELMIGGDMNSWITFEIEEKDDMLGKFRGGGIIISTAAGSTGINKNAGGVILPLESDLWSVVGDKTSKRIRTVTEPRDINIKVSSRRPVTVWSDGARCIIDNVKEIQISKTPKSVAKLVFENAETFKKKRRAIKF